LSDKEGTLCFLTIVKRPACCWRKLWRSTAEKISSYLLCLEGAYYVRFDQLDDNEVVALLRSMHVKEEKADE
jgi:hypothetical protein